MRSIIAALSLIAVAGGTNAQSNTYILQDVRLIDGTGNAARDHVSILIAKGRIAKISSGKINLPGATVLNLSGKTVLPGLINGHGHLGLVSGTSVSPANYTQPIKVPDGNLVSG